VVIKVSLIHLKVVLAF